MTKKERATDKLLSAVGDYVDAHGGAAMVAGGIGIIHEEKCRFKLVISVTGKPPQKKPT